MVHNDHRGWMTVFLECDSGLIQVYIGPLFEWSTMIMVVVACVFLMWWLLVH